YGREAVIDAVGGKRPTVILARLWNIDLITAAGAVLVGPQPACFRVERCTLLVAVAIRPDFRSGAFAFDEGVVIRDAAIGVQADHLALQLVQILRGGALVVLAQGNEEIALAIEYQPDPEVVAAGEL